MIKLILSQKELLGNGEHNGEHIYIYIKFILMLLTVIEVCILVTLLFL